MAHGGAEGCAGVHHIYNPINLCQKNPNRKVNTEDRLPTLILALGKCEVEAD
jgi:hypothetical protein